VSEWIQHAAGLEQRIAVNIYSGPDLTIQADRSQLDQLLINVVSNAVEAGIENNPDEGGQVIVSWKIDRNTLEVRVDDNGLGYNTEKDLFVPFFTTKPQGSGIGLTLGRQIAEAHGGSLFLENHTDKKGCRAVLRLPIQQ
jgi:signal transduction histidine kinase